jgi:hypothetical protein
MPIKILLATFIFFHTLLWGSQSYANGTASAQPGFIVTIERQAQSWWEWASTGVNSMLTFFLPPSPAEVARRLDSEASVFWSLLADAGYDLEEVETSTGVLPGVSATFRMARELTEADREAVERHLDELARQDSGPIAGLQRSVILMLLEAAETNTFRVVRLRVALSPVPSARFTLKPTAPQLVQSGSTNLPGLLSLQHAP